MKSTIFKRAAALLLALVMCLTAFPGLGITAHAATDVTDEIFMIAFPREGDSAYDDDWGHGALSFKNGWHTAKSRYTNIRAIGSYSSQICYCIEPGVSQNTGDEFKQKGENFWDNYPSDYNDVLSPDGFLKDENYHYFEISRDGEIVTVENEAGVGFLNKPISGSVQTTKVDAEYPDHKLTGAIFEVYTDKDGDQVYNAEIDIWSVK